jgi:hypothetical protein
MGAGWILIVVLGSTTMNSNPTTTLTVSFYTKELCEYAQKELDFDLHRFTFSSKCFPNAAAALKPAVK